jgi:hypothetical protein
VIQPGGEYTGGSPPVCFFVVNLSCRETKLSAKQDLSRI